MLRKTMIALLAMAAVSIAAPDVAAARGGGGSFGGGGGSHGGGGFGGGGGHAGGFGGGGFGGARSFGGGGHALAGGTKENPKPLRVLGQLVMAISVIEFSPDLQVLAVASKGKKGALRMGTFTFPFPHIFFWLANE